MCDIVRKSNEWQCADSLESEASKISLPELKKIIRFLETEGKDSKWDTCEVSVENVINGHYDCDRFLRSGWLTMSDERLECLMPYMGERFWGNFVYNESLNDPKTLDIKVLRGIFKSILTPVK